MVDIHSVEVEGGRGGRALTVQALSASTVSHLVTTVANEGRQSVSVGGTRQPGKANALSNSLL